MDPRGPELPDDGNAGSEYANNVHRSPDAHFAFQDGPGGPDPDENFEELRHEFGAAERLSWSEKQADITHDETLAILDHFECSETPWFSREQLEVAAEVFRDWQENPNNPDFSLILVDHMGRLFKAEDNTWDH